MWGPAKAQTSINTLPWSPPSEQRILPQHVGVHVSLALSTARPTNKACDGLPCCKPYSCCHLDASCHIGSLLDAEQVPYKREDEREGPPDANPCHHSQQQQLPVPPHEESRKAGPLPCAQQQSLSVHGARDETLWVSKLPAKLPSQVHICVACTTFLLMSDCRREREGGNMGQVNCIPNKTTANRRLRRFILSQRYPMQSAAGAPTAKKAAAM